MNSQSSISFLLTLGLGLMAMTPAQAQSSGALSGNVSAYALGDSYVLGQLNGALAKQLPTKFRPNHKWRGETDGPVMLSGATLMKLKETQRDTLRKLLKQENPIIITKATQAHIDALHQLLGVPSGVDLKRMPAAYATLDAYGVAKPRGQLRMMAVAPFPKAKKAEPKTSIEQRALGIARWVNSQVKGQKSLVFVQAASPLQLSSTSYPWSLTVQDAMPASWATCGMSASGEQCVDQVTQIIDVWPVYNSNAPAGQPTDYFIVNTSANVNTAGCQDFYGSSRSHSTRIAGYWLRQFNSSAQVPGMGIDSLSIAPGYAPQSVNPDVQVTTGTSWSISGTGTAGVDSDGPSGSLGFTAGVSYSNTKTQTYPALSTQVNINSTSATANVASWTYDSWTFVHESIEPSNHACGGPGLNVTAALPSIIYGGTFSPNQNWVWQALPAVRTAFGGTTLPVTVSSSMLLGWAYYNGGEYCTVGSQNPLYWVNGQSTQVIGAGPSAGINFDVSCNVVTNYGTIPLGPWGPSGQNNNVGNPGTPFALPAWAVNVPFAPTALPCPTLNPAQATATVPAGLAPTSGPVGTVVTLSGTNLNTAASVNFGGTSIPSTNFSLVSPTTITVTAPTGRGTVEVSVANTSCTSNSLPYTYTP